MKYLLASVGAALAAGIVVVAMQAPPPRPQNVALPFQNVRIEARQGMTIEAAVAALEPRTAGAAAEPAWIAWRVPLAGGVQDLCSWYSDWTGAVRGAVLDSPPTAATERPLQFVPPLGPVPLEAGSGLLILVRVADGHMERLRWLRDDCPIDAGGRLVQVLDGISVDASLRYLEHFVTPSVAGRANEEGRRRRQQQALRAMALHQDGVPRLIALGRTTTDALVRRDVVSALGQTSDPRAFDYLEELIRR